MLSIVTLRPSRHWQEFLLAMTEKEIKARYKHALLGFLWIVLNPLLQMLVIGLVFQFFVPVKVDNYFLFLFAGLLPWNFFSLSLAKTTPAIVFERSLIQKAKFPREVIILSIVLANAFHLVISLALLILILLASSLFHGLIIAQFTFSSQEITNLIVRSIMLVPSLLWLISLTGCLSLLLSTLNVRFRDVTFMVNAVIPLWFYATPIIYTLNLLPQFLQPLAYLNPLTGITELFHWVLLDMPVTSVLGVSVSLIVSIVLSLLGVMVFKKESHYFDDWV